jgi:DNA-directed RNA polymerase subunit RPC12/RpoP
MKKSNSKIGRLPKCHECGRILEDVYENQYWTFWFNEKTGKYEGDLVDLEIRCPVCNAHLRAEFPEGVCNFSMT